MVDLSQPVQVLVENLHVGVQPDGERRGGQSGDTGPDHDDAHGCDARDATDQ